MLKYANLYKPISIFILTYKRKEIYNQELGINLYIIKFDLIS